MFCRRRLPSAPAPLRGRKGRCPTIRHSRDARLDLAAERPLVDVRRHGSTDRSKEVRIPEIAQ
jgi:hypothetical protein